MGFPFATVFKLVAQFIPGQLGAAVAAAEDAAMSGADKKTKAIEIAAASLNGFNSVIGGLDVTQHPDLVSKVGKVNDAIVELSNAIATVSTQAHTPPPPLTTPAAPAMPGTPPGPLPQADGAGQ